MSMHFWAVALKQQMLSTGLLSSSLLSTTSSLSSCCRAGLREGSWGAFQTQLVIAWLSHTYTLYPSTVHICKSRRHPIHLVKRVCVHVRFPFLHFDNCTNGYEVAHVIVGDGMLLPLTQLSASSIVCAPVQLGSTSSSFLPIHVDEPRNDTMALNAELLTCLPIVPTKDGLVEPREGMYRNERHF